jgi:hypothetical protein
MYSNIQLSWKDDNFLNANAPFPMLAIDADAGKYFIGQDPNGNNNGWTWVDVPGFGIRTRKLLRSIGWSEIDANGIVQAVWPNLTTLGQFEDPANDFAYYQFGTDSSVDDTANFTFAGPVNEAVAAYEEIGNPASCDFATSSTITRSAGSFITDGYKVGGRVTIRNATVGGNNGTFVLTAVAATTLTVTGTPFTTGADANAILVVDNLNAITLRLRVRDADPTGKTYAQANLASGGETVLSNRIFRFPLANGSDPKITATDGDIDTLSPYTGMSIELFAAPQSLGGSGELVGGPFNFGMVIDGNNGTDVQVYEFVQRQLRRLTDIDDGAGVAIGRALDGLMRFNGDNLEVGSVDGGITFPTNPRGGGSGVYITNLNAVSRNTTTYRDNTGAVRGHPIGSPVTLDFNEVIEGDADAAYALFFDRTIRSAVGDLVITAGTGAAGTFDSAGANLPAALDVGVGAYVRIAGYTGADAAMNGIYQVTALTSQSQWDVIRRDNATIVTTGAASCNLDEHPIDSPDNVIVDDNLGADVAGLVGGVDVSFTFDYSNNAQGGRTPATDAFVVAKVVGQGGTQYARSSVQQIESGQSLTVTLIGAIERNFSNPS